jgi:Na+-transporting NADH:ubiquinone oxidoreductase subunit B
MAKEATVGERPVQGEADAPPKSYPLIRWQKPMILVLAACIPAAASGVYRFGWRSLAVMAVTGGVAFLAEWLFTRSRKEPVTSAVFVTAALLALTLPPTVPFWIAAVGAFVGICFGKEMFGGFGRNVFNPALVGRCFIYVCFPVAMTGRWVQPASGWPGGLASWITRGIDASSQATPLIRLRTMGLEGLTPHLKLLIGERAGCIGETAAIAILLGAALLLIRKVADWRLMAGCAGGALLLSTIFWLTDGRTPPDPLWDLLAGGFLFGAVFMITDPVSAAKTRPGKWIYAFLVGGLTVLMRRFGVFPEGIMFAILMGNTFVPAIDIAVRAASERKKAAA